MIVASTMVPPATFRPRAARCSFTRSNSNLPRSWAPAGGGSSGLSFRPEPDLAEVDADEPPHRQRIVQRFLRARVGQVEPVLQEVQPQHHFKLLRRPTIAGSWVERFNDSAQLTPRHDVVHLGENRPMRFVMGLLPFSRGLAKCRRMPKLTQTIHPIGADLLKWVLEAASGVRFFDSAPGNERASWSV